MVFKNIIDESVPYWNEKDLGEGRTFSDIFQIDGFSLDWFYDRMLIDLTIPKHFKWGLSLKNRFLRKIYLQSFLLLFKKYVSLNLSFKNLVQERKGFSKIDLLFLSYVNHKNNGKIYRLQEIIDLLNKRTSIKNQVLFIDSISNFSFKKNCSVLYSFATPRCILEARTHARNFHSMWKNLDKKFLFEGHWDELKYYLNLFYSYEFMYFTILTYLTFKEMLKVINAKVVVITAINGIFEKAIIAAAKNGGIGVIFIQHGVGTALVKIKSVPGIKYLIFGRFFIDRLLRSGIDAKDIYVVGTIFDGIKDYIPIAYRKKGKFVLVTGPFVEDGRMSLHNYNQCLYKILRAVGKFSSEIVIKVHPREQSKKYYHFQNEVTNLKIVSGLGLELYKNFYDADIVINFFSTAVLEAMLLGKPILTIDIQPEIHSEFKKGPYSGGVQVKIDQDLEAALLKTIEDPEEIKKKRERTIREFCYKSDCKAQERIVSFITKFVEKYHLN